MNKVDEYISNFPENIGEILSKIRAIIKEVAPDASENISYWMPAYKTNDKPLVYFAGFKNHIWFYATPKWHEKFINELSKYKQGKWSVQFPINKAIPFDLIKKIVEFRKKENLSKN